jgi:hypothetical protein
MSNKIASSILVILLLLAWTVGRIECGKRKNQGNPKDKGKAQKNPMDESQNTAAGRADQNVNDPEKGSDAEMEGNKVGSPNRLSKYIPVLVGICLPHFLKFLYVPLTTKQ